MESLTKNRQNEETLRRMVGRFFHPLELQSYKELTEGYFNVAYEVTLSSGEAVILKVAPAEGVRVIHGSGFGRWEQIRIARALFVLGNQ